MNYSPDMYISDHTITSKHYLVHFVCAFASGIFLAIRFGIIASLIFTLPVAILPMLVCIILKAAGIFKKKYLILSLALLTALLLGIFRVFCTEYLQSNNLKKYAGQDVWLCGTVTSDPHITSSGYYYSFELDVFGVAEHPGNFGTVMMYVPTGSGCNFSASDSVYAWTSLKIPENNGDSPHFDYPTHLRGKNIFLTGTAKVVNPLSDSRLSPVITLKNGGAWLRGKIGHSAEELFALNPDNSAILRGILIGDKSGFTDDLYNRFSYSGISHIISVSGLHMSILFSFFMIASKRFRLNKKLNLWVTIPAILLFMSASGFTPSVCRAAVMIIVMICSTLFREEYDSTTSLFLALGLILCTAPYSLFSKSLILSFGATLSIFLYYPHINGILNALISHPRLRLKKHGIVFKTGSYIISSFSLSLSALIGTAYFLILFFDGISKVQFFTNLWIIPLVSIIFCFGYICCILYYVCPWLVEYVLKYPLGWCLDIINLTINKFGIMENMFNISSKNLNISLTILYFGTALMIYMFFKAVHDIAVQNKKAQQK